MIEIKNLFKTFRVYKSKVHLLKSLVGLAKEGRDYALVESLKDISLGIPKGEVHGIIGVNGAGKSTLLKILAGVMDPTRGSFKVHGTVASLLELGTGFHGELTGRENIYINGALLGFSKEDVDHKVESIRDFAEIGDFFDRPVKIYSSGMYVRLAFAFATSVDPDVLIVDEALSVGDIYFQQKCLRKIMEFKKKGVTILFVSHDIGAVKRLCDRCTLLSYGRVVKVGSPLQCIDMYNALLATQRKDEALKLIADWTATDAAKGTFESGNKRLEVLEVRMFNQERRPTNVFISGERGCIGLKVRAGADHIENPTFGILIRDRLGYDIFGTNSFLLGINSGTPKMGEVFDVFYDVDMNLGPGDYTLTVSLHAGETHIEENFHWIDRAQAFKVVLGGSRFIGVSALNPVCSVKYS